MTKAPKRPRDLNQWAKRMIDIATGEVEDGEPTPEEQGKDPAAVARGKLGGEKGGKALGRARGSAGPIQPFRVYRRAQDQDIREARREAHFNILRRAQQSQHPHAFSADDAPDKRLLNEDGKPRSRDGASLPLLQFRPHPQDA